MFNRASQRDKDRTIRILSEIRSAQAHIYRNVLQQMMGGVQTAHQTFTDELRRIHQEALETLKNSDAELQGTERLVNTILNQGANLAREISGREKRNVVDSARKKIDELLENAENNRARLIKQMQCEHNYAPTVVRDGEDGYTNVIEAMCTNCEKELEIPSEESIVLEKRYNEEKVKEVVQ